MLVSTFSSVCDLMDELQANTECATRDVRVVFWLFGSSLTSIHSTREVSAT